MNRLFWIIIALIGGVTLLLMANNDSGTTLGMANDAFANAAYLGIWGIVIAAALLGSGMRLSDFARSIAIWVVIILALVAGYQYRYELQDVANRVTAGLIPGSAISNRSSDGSLTVTLAKAANGHFQVNGKVNGAGVSFLVDTGASMVILSSGDAKRAGINTASLSYSVPIMTANGTTSAAMVRLATLQIGDIERHDIRALVAQDNRMDGSLLGMNFLETLHGFSVRGDELVLSD
ncbi:TIGR02281 family clan AA aspartic protease [Phyllobacterium salinisoli]|uniref:TIGR02281 family clan AA aspartic protease n=1 Tax=Phyllobacterium salinisoli TaxID=1899321 RepID=A0A368K7W2_9HYPH|nr:TIGR02281 family clan AA aspartic protease [Phyllobacterium salinisoli]RCS25321.1 TIGR02281 family clan AA aspartic protease [Phyllobacterium salinisoli]